MRATARAVFVAALVSAAFISSPAAAQTLALEPATTFRELALRVPPDALLVVADQEDQQQAGRLVGIDTGTLTIQSLRRITFAEPDVKVVRQKMPDRILDGGLIGFAIGTLAPLAVCTSRSDSSETVGCAIGSVAFGGLPGFAIGALIDRARGRMVTIFRATAGPGPRTNP